jgi:putative endonuclease
MSNNTNYITTGIISEKEALNFLVNRGLRLLAQNYHCIYGELDLIMQEGDVLVFVEVRLRSHKDYGDAFESIDSTKQQKLLKSATHYLQKHRLLDKIDCRFDVIGFSNNAIEWIKDAFSYE